MIITPRQAYLHAYENGVKFPKDWYITKNFTWNEAFTNEELADGIPLYEVFENVCKLAQYLQELRDKLDTPIIIHCWVRQARHNKRVGGAKLSAHLNGCAVDFHIKDIQMEQARKFILASRIPVRIEANTPSWVHIDISNYVRNFRVGLFNA